MLGQQLPQTNEKCYSVLQCSLWLFLPPFYGSKHSLYIFCLLLILLPLPFVFFERFLQGPELEAMQNCKIFRVMIWMMCNSAIQVAAGRADHHSRLLPSGSRSDQLRQPLVPKFICTVTVTLNFRTHTCSIKCSWKKWLTAQFNWFIRDESNDIN